MEATFIWGMVLSAIVCGVAIAAEGRGRHGLKVLLGMTPRTEKLNVYDDVERPEVTWDLIGYINDPRVLTGEIPLRAIHFREVVNANGVAVLTTVHEGQAKPLRAPRSMPPSIPPRRREAITASR